MAFSVTSANLRLMGFAVLVVSAMAVSFSGQTSELLGASHNSGLIPSETICSGNVAPVDGSCLCSSHTQCQVDPDDYCAGPTCHFGPKQICIGNEEYNNWCGNPDDNEENLPYDNEENLPCCSGLYCISGYCDFPACGDGIVQPGEQCDDIGDSPDCDADCTYRTCGDGYINYAAGEQCDDQNTNQDDECNNYCEYPFCGDGAVNNGEDCDNGGICDASNGQACITNIECTDILACTHQASATCDNECLNKGSECGDGIIEGGEECDDGDDDNNVCDEQCNLVEREYFCCIELRTQCESSVEESQNCPLGKDKYYYTPGPGSSDEETQLNRCNID